MVELKHELRNEGRNMVMNEEIRSLIAAADRAIKEERFDDLMEFYTDDAVLVVRPGLEV